MDQKVIDLYDAYTHGGISRRLFLDRLARRDLARAVKLSLDRRRSAG